MSKLIDSNTICIVASTPEFAYGTIDPVKEIAALAVKWNIGCHVDSCYGSFVFPFMEKLGYKADIMDFRVPGVTSISCDAHKFGYGPKGLSIAMWRERDTREYQFFANTQWNGGVYATTAIAGSRPGNIIVGTWAALLKTGVEGYEKKAKDVFEA